MGLSPSKHTFSYREINYTKKEFTLKNAAQNQKTHNVLLRKIVNTVCLQIMGFFEGFICGSRIKQRARNSRESKVSL